MMIPRAIGSKVEAALASQAAVALIGPRQVGKTTLAHEIAKTRPSIYLDLEAAADRDKLSDPALFLDRQVDKAISRFAPTVPSIACPSRRPRRQHPS
jgi:uncharacterized protein